MTVSKRIFPLQPVPRTTSHGLLNAPSLEPDAVSSMSAQCPPNAVVLQSLLMRRRALDSCLLSCECICATHALRVAHFVQGMKTPCLTSLLAVVRCEAMHQIPAALPQSVSIPPVDTMAHRSAVSRSNALVAWQIDWTRPIGQA